MTISDFDSRARSLRERYAALERQLSGATPASVGAPEAGRSSQEASAGVAGARSGEREGNPASSTATAATDDRPLAALRARQRAQRLEVTEAELVAAACDPIQSTALISDPQAIFRELGGLGRVMALTRNEWCVHERHGRYETVHANGPMGLVLGPDIDLRLFFSLWKSAWAVRESGRESLQFFDGAGTAIHKIYRTEDTDASAWAALIERFTAPEPQWPSPLPPKQAMPPEPLADPEAFRQSWLAMTDTHDFSGLLKRFNVARTDALAGAGPDLAQRVATDCAQRVLEEAAASGTRLMCFVGNRGMIQIHTGTVQHLRRTGPWYNVLDADFNLHLDTSAIDSAWVVAKPTADGWVYSLEVFAGSGELIVQFFGERKPGRPAAPEWGAMLRAFCSLPLAA